RSGSVEPGHQHVAELVLAEPRSMGDTLGRPSPFIEPFLHEIGHLIHTGRDERPAVDVHGGSEVVEIRVVSLLDQRPKLGDLDGGRRRHSPATSCGSEMPFPDGAPSAVASSGGGASPPAGALRILSSASISLLLGVAVAPRPRAAARTVRRFASAISSF